MEMHGQTVPPLSRNEFMEQIRKELREAQRNPHRAAMRLARDACEQQRARRELREVWE